MNICSYKRFGSIATTLVVFLLASCGCKLTTDKSTPNGGRDAVVMTVLSYMVINAADDTNIVRFVDADPETILRLKKHFGGRYVIYPITAGSITDRGAFTKDSNRGGIAIEVTVEEFNRNEATLIGAYSDAYSGVVGFRYKLRYSGNTWKIISKENTISS
jgi:hypothetical protein